MERVLLDQVVDTDYGQFDLIWSGDGGFDGNHDRFFDGQINGLVGASDRSGVYLHFARRSGGSHVKIVLLNSAPESIADHWEDLVEVSIAVPDGDRVDWLAWEVNHREL